jgi:hypothetical protein
MNLYGIVFVILILLAPILRILIEYAALRLSERFPTKASTDQETTSDTPRNQDR